MARQMNPSRSQLDRLLDPENEGVELQTLVRRGASLGSATETRARVSAYTRTGSSRETPATSNSPSLGGNDPKAPAFAVLHCPGTVGERSNT
ncbi:MAG: hypothetical protein ACREYE_32720 [Gammaproteobacteria bacterium]